MLNYKQLYYFWQVAKLGGITRAAEQLHLTPQTLSGQIAELEVRGGWVPCVCTETPATRRCLHLLCAAYELPRPQLLPCMLPANMAPPCPVPAPTAEQGGAGRGAACARRRPRVVAPGVGRRVVRPGRM